MRHLILALLVWSACNPPALTAPPHIPPIATADIGVRSSLVSDAPCPPFVVDADNRVAFQCALSRGLLDLRGTPGRYYVDTPAWPRSFAVLTMPDDAVLIGDGSETIAFRGDPMGHDWRGIQPSDRGRITGITLELTDTASQWDEQSHLVEIVGPLTGFRLDHVKFFYPVAAGISRGDCLRIRCYSGSRCWNVEVDNNIFSGCARSGVAIYSGLHGSRLPDGTCSTRFHHNVFDDVSDQDLDCEGGGDIGGIDATDCVEWDHNVHHTGHSIQSSIAVSLYPGSVDFHHNVLDGRGLDLLGGSHHVHDNVITQTMPNGGAPVVYLRKAGSSRFNDELWVRTVSAGPGAIFVAAQKITGPTNVKVQDVRMRQHTASPSIAVQGVDGVELHAVDLVDDGPQSTTKTGALTFRDAVQIEGTNGAAGIRTTGVVIRDSSFAGNVRSVVSVSGGGGTATSFAAGVGTIVIDGNSSSGAAFGLRCENTRKTATSGGISGPVTYDNRAMAAPGPCIVGQ